MTQDAQQQAPQQEVDVVVVGAGFAGLHALHELRGRGLSVRVLEAGHGVGGTWYWNRYPGARCDVESTDYQFSFSEDLVREWRWSERYPRQEELLRYLDHVADRFDLRRDISLGRRVVSAVLEEEDVTWTVATEQGERWRARWLIMATGCLSVPRLPLVPGLEDFRGDWYHTASWPADGVDFTGERVAVVGTGSSGIQSIPLIAEQAAGLLVLQRTANYSVPAFNHELGEEELERLQQDFAARREFTRSSALGLAAPADPRSALAVSEEERRTQYETRWRMGGLPMIGAFADLMVDRAANETAAAFFHDKIRAKVDDPETAEKLLPRGYPWGAKRVCVDSGYYETFNRSDVTLIDLNEQPLRGITPRGVLVGETEHEVDAIVFATGFDAMTGALMAIDIRGRDGRSLRQAWSAGPKTYLGLAVAGFPGLFTVTGPGSPSVLSNMVVSIEQHVEWIADAISWSRERGTEVFEATQEAQEAWVEHVNAVADSTLFTEANSWYLGANVPGKPRVFMPYAGGVGAYRQKCDEVAAAGYEGFRAVPAPGAERRRADRSAPVVA
ncbi:flavin-containing monooxygenase [Kineococcus sp. SYSU DK018]|uniref:flavin-containing monooxygenase n=1 Tax=Kineococcus sp. SYSU DK018 TaxID=3383139 RepID=UPI003D7E9D25